MSNIFSVKNSQNFPLLKEYLWGPNIVVNLEQLLKILELTVVELVYTHE
ncbi:MAG: hypothetical protein MK289_23270 [Trichodesmium sp. ALOHA_ZT_67]|nr:hypothetical protein [Trichodesmium sp. ALOHA_ZT_67]